MLLVKTGYETAKRFEFSGVKTKFGTKKHAVLFKVYCDDTDVKECIDLYRSSKNVIMLEYQGTLSTLGMQDLSNVYITRVYDFGTNISEDDVKGVVEELIDGLVGVIRLPQEYSDMRFIYNMSQKYSNIRFCGGSIFCIDGCNVGCCGRDILDKDNVKYDDTEYFHEGCCCALETVPDTEVILEEGVVKKSQSSSGKTSGGKKKVALFKNLLYSGGTHEL